MGLLAGVSSDWSLRVDFDRRLPLQFRGSVATSDADCSHIGNSMTPSAFPRWRATFSPPRKRERMAGTLRWECCGSPCSEGLPVMRT